MAKQAASETARAPLSLYRKYRPLSFKDVLGQDHVVSILKAAIENGKVAHAYIFAGRRGTGKTSMARIFAHALDTAEEDIYEMDAASNRGIDEIRQLRDGVSTLPFNSAYKFYIIDEAHALTKDAWGALLKTLEEPPSHVIFVLATTELDKVPETIISRCQVFGFTNPTIEVLKKMVLDVAKKEGAQIEPAAAELVALMGDGSFRDTLGILQKVLTLSSDTKLTEEEVAKVVGAPSGELVNEFLEAVALKQPGEAIAAFHRAIAAGSQPAVFIMLAMQKVRGILLLRFLPKAADSLAEQFSQDDITYLTDLSGAKGAAINAEVLAQLISAYVETARAPLPQVPLELALYRLFA